MGRNNFTDKPSHNELSVGGSLASNRSVVAQHQSFS